MRTLGRVCILDILEPGPGNKDISRRIIPKVSQNLRIPDPKKASEYQNVFKTLNKCIFE